jgi:dolichyl-phosphate-mannose--protein O-mannosyl transferase
MQIIRPTPDSSSKQGDAIETGGIIKLQHMRTRRWLHSHLHASPLSGNLEVSLISISPVVTFINSSNSVHPSNN